MGSRHRLGLAATTLGVALVLTFVPSLSVAEAAFPGANGLIGYTRAANKPIDVFVVQPDGSGATNLTKSRIGASVSPSWNADGTRIVFVTFNGSRQVLMTMDADGSNATRVIGPISRRFHAFWSPSWSPDGSKIAVCVSNDRFTVSRIYIVDLTGSSVTRLSPTGTQDCDPVWSPDGTRIAFSTWLDSNLTIATMATDGTGRTIVVGDGINYQPDWSPDGSKIVFVSSQGNGDLFLVNSDGSGLTRLTGTPRSDGDPAFAPDGSMVVFTRWARQFRELWTIGADGTGLLRLTDTPADEYAPDWQPT